MRRKAQPEVYRPEPAAAINTRRSRGTSVAAEPALLALLSAKSRQRSPSILPSFPPSFLAPFSLASVLPSSLSDQSRSKRRSDRWDPASILRRSPHGHPAHLVRPSPARRPRAAAAGMLAVTTAVALGSPPRRAQHVMNAPSSRHVYGRPPCQSPVQRLPVTLAPVPVPVPVPAL